MRGSPEKNRSLETYTEVTPQEKVFLVNGDSQILIHAKCASKYSLSFRYSEDQHFSGTDQPVKLVIQINGKRIELTPCRIFSVPDPEGYTGRLIGINDVYDFERLLLDKKIVKMLTTFHDLPKELARKDRVRRSFKDFIANLSHDLQVYKTYFDTLDSQLEEEPEDVKNALQCAIIDTKGRDFRNFFQEKLDELASLVDKCSLKEHQLQGSFFRTQLWNFILGCPFAARAALKPRGFPGDSEQMRMIYLNDYQGDSTFFKLMHKHAVEHTASQSVRNRAAIISRMIKNFGSGYRLPDNEEIRILSVGCGPAFELKDIFESPRQCREYKFTLFDQDPIALTEAAELVQGIQNNLSSPPDVHYVQGSIRTMLFSRQIPQQWGQFHFIYSMGLFDYLTPRVAKAVLDRLYHLLKRGGEMVIANFHISNPSRYFMEYWGDWVLLHRTEEEFKDLFQHPATGKARLFFDGTGSQMFLHILKKKTAT